MNEFVYCFTVTLAMTKFIDWSRSMQEVLLKNYIFPLPLKSLSTTPCNYGLFPKAKIVTEIQRIKKQ